MIQSDDLHIIQMSGLPKIFAFPLYLDGSTFSLEVSHGWSGYLNLDFQ